MEQRDEPDLKRVAENELPSSKRQKPNSYDKELSSLRSYQSDSSASSTHEYNLPEPSGFDKYGQFSSENASLVNGGELRKNEEVSMDVVCTDTRFDDKNSEGGGIMITSDSHDDNVQVRREAVLDTSLSSNFERDYDTACLLLVDVDRTLIHRRLLQLPPESRVQITVNEALEGYLEEMVTNSIIVLDADNMPVVNNFNNNDITHNGIDINHDTALSHNNAASTSTSCLPESHSGIQTTNNNKFHTNCPVIDLTIPDLLFNPVNHTQDNSEQPVKQFAFINEDAILDALATLAQLEGSLEQVVSSSTLNLDTDNRPGINNFVNKDVNYIGIDINHDAVLPRNNAASTSGSCLPENHSGNHATNRNRYETSQQIPDSAVGLLFNAVNNIQDIPQQPVNLTIDESILKDTMLIAEMLPYMDGNDVYARLESSRDNANRVELVIDELLAQPSLLTSFPRSASGTADTACVRPLSNDKTEDVSSVDAQDEHVSAIESSPSINIHADPHLNEDIALVLSAVPQADVAYVTSVLQDHVQEQFRVIMCINTLQGHGPVDINDKNRESHAYREGTLPNNNMSITVNKSCATSTTCSTTSTVSQKPHTVTSEGDCFIEKPCTSGQAELMRFARLKQTLKDLNIPLDGPLAPSSGSASGILPLYDHNGTIAPTDCIDLSIPKTNQDDVESHVIQDAVADVAEASGVSDEEMLEKATETILAVFPDCEKFYVVQKLIDRYMQPNACQMIITEMLDEKHYPKRSDTEEMLQSEKNRRDLLDVSFTIDDFLEKFSEPTKHFYDQPKTDSENYVTCALLELRKRFPFFTVSYIIRTFTTDCRSSFIRAVRCMEAEHAQIMIRGAAGREIRRKSNKYRVTPRSPEKHNVRVLDEYFIHERHFTYHEQQITEYINKKQTERNQTLNYAKENGLLLECPCCYDDEVLNTDMSACPEGHMFCHECIRRSSEVKVGEANFKFTCLNKDCVAAFSINVLKTVLSSKIFSVIIRKVQEEEVRQAGIEDLVACPYCHFATIMPDHNDKVLKCLNPDCLKETCRWCQEDNHIPLRCEEVEKKAHSEHRLYIEARMTEAMLRVCVHCKTRFYKTEGCNKMTCPRCRQTMCYICRVPDVDYNHFQERENSTSAGEIKKCPLWCDSTKLHAIEAEYAAREAQRPDEGSGTGAAP